MRAEQRGEAGDVLRGGTPTKVFAMTGPRPQWARPVAVCGSEGRMATRRGVDRGAQRIRALAMLDHGASVNEVAAAAGVTAATVRRWKQKWVALWTAGKAELDRDCYSVSGMLRREGPAVARVLLDQAKEGDVRAAALVVRLLGNTLTTEARDEGERGGAERDLAAALEGLPPSIAYEIVGLLAQAGSAPAGDDTAADAEAKESAVGAGRLPWEEDDSPPDQGGGEV